MTKAIKQLNSPFATGGGGVQFEAHVQASFVVLMLTGGFAPCIPYFPITKIKLQGKFDGYDTDDLIVFLEESGGGEKRKILGQIKHFVTITEKDPTFGEVIQAAWNDFNNPEVFTRGKDVIALITGPLSATTANDVNTILEWARTAEKAGEFLKKAEETNFSSKGKKNKLQAFKTQLRKANGDNPISDDSLFAFLRHFHLLVYDLDIKAGVNLSLLQSLIGQYSQEKAQSLWTQLVDEVQHYNKNAGTIVPENLPDSIRTVFKRRVYEMIPEEFSASQIAADKPDWNQSQYAPELTVANLVGAWNENNPADGEIIHQIARQDFSSWLSKMRELLQQPLSPVSLKNGKWNVNERKDLWRELGKRIFDDNLDGFRRCAVAVLSERHPMFDLPSGERYAASIHGKVSKHSIEIRNGMAEGLALLGSRPNDLTSCSQDRAEVTAVLAVRELFEKADWILWGSLNNLLPILAEAAPDEFLNAVEKALQQSPCPFDELFAQEGSGIAGQNYMTGLLWALEGLAWDQKYLVRVCAILGDLAFHDPGGNWANRPSNSLTTILLPWLPQTTAPIEKRKVALQTLQKEVPTVAWKLLISLLPNQHQISSGTHKPSWRDIIPAEWKKGATHEEYWEQVSFYTKLALSMANEDMDKLEELIGHLDSMPKEFFDEMLKHLSSEAVLKQPESKRLPLWMALSKFSLKHKRFSDAQWALGADIVSKIEQVAQKLAPENPLNLHRRLFTGHDSDLYEEKGNFDKQRQKLAQTRQQAIKDILTYGGIETVIKFAEDVESPMNVGRSLGAVSNAETDAAILPSLLDTKNQKLAQLAETYIWGRQYKDGWKWVDGLDRSSWSIAQSSQFLSYLPFRKETWERAGEWLGTSEGEYWKKTVVNPYQSEGDIGYAIGKLIDFGRPNVAIDCLNAMLFNKEPLDKALAVKALLAAINSKEPSYTIDPYETVEVIKALQEDPDTDPDDLFRVEWAYLILLDRNREASPKLLEKRLATDPAFFCEVIRLIYRSKKETTPDKEPSKEEQAVATNAWRLLDKWQTPPGKQPDGSFSGQGFLEWFAETKAICAESGHLDIALRHIGQVLFYCPPGPQGLWIDQAAANALDAKDAERMRDGFCTEAFNSRGVHWVDPTGKPERELAEQYKQKADDIENAGYQRFAATLRNLSESYERDADRVVAEHGQLILNK